MRELRLRAARALRVREVRVGRSATDPLYRLAPGGVLPVRAAAVLESSLVTGDAEVVEPVGRDS